MIRSLSQRAN